MSRVAAAAACVVRWMTVSDRWAGHRPEPLIAERLWACTVEGEGTQQVGLDAAGRPVLVGPAGRPPEAWTAPPDWVDVVEYAPDGRSVTVHGFGRALSERRLTTTFDADGRALVTTYAGAPDERYAYDDTGRLVAIEESAGAIEFAPPRWREDPEWPVEGTVTGRLDVVYGGAEPAQVLRASDGLVIWERIERPWPQARSAYAGALAEVAAAGLADELRDHGVDPHEEVFALALVAADSAWSTLTMGLFAGMQATRERLLDDPDTDAEEYLWLLQPPDGGFIAGGVNPPEALDRAALRATAMHEVDDAREAAAQAIAARLAVRDWSAHFAPTPDFVVYVIGGDWSERRQYESMVAANPPERVAERAARWRGAPYPPPPDDH